MLGPKVYFPNFVFTLIRSENLLPNQVAFRVPMLFNKYDIRHYLEGLYGVKITQVDTIRRDARIERGRRRPGFKKAIVTLFEPFEYPAEENI